MPKIDTVALKAHEQDQKKVSPCLCKDCQNCWSPRDKHPYSIEEKVVAVGLISTPLSEALIELVLDYYYDEWLEMNSLEKSYTRVGAFEMYDQWNVGIDAAGRYIRRSKPIVFDQSAITQPPWKPVIDYKFDHTQHPDNYPVIPAIRILNNPSLFDFNDFRYPIKPLISYYVTFALKDMIQLSDFLKSREPYKQWQVNAATRALKQCEIVSTCGNYKVIAHANPDPRPLYDDLGASITRKCRLDHKKRAFALIKERDQPSSAYQ